MAAASLDELRFFLDDRDDIAQRVRATGATTTQVMAAIGVHEEHVVVGMPATAAEAAVREVCMILDEEEQIVEVDLDDLLDPSPAE